MLKIMRAYSTQAYLHMYSCTLKILAFGLSDGIIKALEEDRTTSKGAACEKNLLREKLMQPDPYCLECTANIA